MLIIRLQRVGRRNDLNFRLVVTDSKRGPKSGGYLEALGSYSPKTKKAIFKNERIKRWVANGARISATARSLLVKGGIIIK
ncbi:30S ribosomal protein S16 [Candidatus Giovannonibacteria bacterium RIFCSPHIGHO2_01_FULL_45_24]|uniref:30S ribosomal protein S16 n=1 Tax=Candidatus Giovannonibacteria bacterium RIFCSPLOWO2_01_FULL_46_32 TaxID=1798353 RepID=A0A1F5XHC5_9BACT|nr:MAG: 30S ribosomal protein S16 [Candidatus Giovannonibacteria bacterium RIFCSPHIGHO2_01_FULL_45_24]OGF87335.1 MAG: 30S ribosomal protein S16 [Candidatus Giovannonibacteria bacterium RIFCSPLOWO2_01_FULL_46_32]